MTSFCPLCSSPTEWTQDLVEIDEQFFIAGRRLKTHRLRTSGILRALLARPTRLVTNEQLIFALYGQRVDGGPDSAGDIVKIGIMLLRRELAGTEFGIETIHGHGYRLVRHQPPDTRRQTTDRKDPSP